MEEEKAAAYYDELRQKGSGAAKFKRGLGFGSNAGERNGEFLGFKAAEGIVDLEETEARKVLAADNIRSKLSKGKEESKKNVGNRALKENESRKPEASNKELKPKQKKQIKNDVNSTDSEGSYGSRERKKVRRRGSESKSPVKDVKRTKRGGGEGKEGVRKGRRAESESGSEFESDEGFRRGKRGDRGKESERKKEKQRRRRSVSTDTSGSSRDHRNGKEGIRRHGQAVRGDDRWRPSRSLSRERSYEKREDLGEERDSQAGGGKREVGSNRIQTRIRSRSRSQSPGRDINRRRRRQHSKSPHRQISRRREREKTDGSRSRNRGVSQSRSRSWSRSRSPVRSRRRSRSPRYRRREDRVRSRRRSKSRSRDRSRRRSRSRERERESERDSRRGYRSSSPVRGRQGLERERRESPDRQRRRRSPSGDKFTSVFSKAPDKDYSKLIPGYDDMTAVEKIKAKTKLQLSEAVVRDSKKGMSTEWERFEFDKDAPLDDDAKQHYFGDGTGAKEDTEFLQNGGSTFVSSRGQVIREAQTTAVHDAAIFGTELKDKNKSRQNSLKSKSKNFDTSQKEKNIEENGEENSRAGGLFLVTNGTLDNILVEEEDEEDKPVVLETENGKTEVHKEKAVSSFMVSEKVVQMQKNMTWQERARKMRESRGTAPPS